MPQVLLVSGSDYSQQVYSQLSHLRTCGIELFLLSDGTFHPREPIFKSVFVSELGNSKETLRAVSQHDLRIDAVVTKSSEWLTPLTALLSKHFNTKGPSPRSAFLCRSKLDMREAFQRANLPTPRFHICRSFEEIIDTAREFGGRCVAKPVAGDASFGAFLISPDDSFEDLRVRYTRSIECLKLTQGVQSFEDDELEIFGDDRSLNLVTDYLVEEFLSGTQISIDSLVRDSLVYPMGIAHQIRSAPPYFVQVEESMPFLCYPDLLESILTANEEAIRSVELCNAATHTELILTEAGPRVLEIACRIGGDNIHDAVLQTTGYSLFTELILLLLGEERKLEYQPQGAVAMRYFLPNKSGILRSVDVSAGLQRDARVSELQLNSQLGQLVQIPPSSFDHLGYIQVKGADHKEAREALDELFPQVRFVIE